MKEEKNRKRIEKKGKEGAVRKERERMNNSKKSRNKLEKNGKEGKEQEQRCDCTTFLWYMKWH